MKKIMVFCLFFLALNAVAYCGQPSKIELADGSVINGEIVSLANGVYIINTLGFGEIKVSAEKVSKIESANDTLVPVTGSTTAAPGNSINSQVSAYKQTLMNNPENVAIFSGLSNSPGLQKMASDPELIEAAKKGDIQALMNNPKFMDIVNSPELQEAVNKIKK